MKEVFHDPATGEPWLEGDNYTRPDMANTLETLASNGDAGQENLGFYDGPLGRDFVSDLAELGGIMTEQDLRDYRVVWSEPVSVELDSLDARLYSNPPPASGALMAAVLNILDNYNIKPEDDNPLLYHRITEAFKWVFAKRTLFGDPGDDDIADTVNEMVTNITSELWAHEIFSRISGSSH